MVIELMICSLRDIRQCQKQSQQHLCIIDDENQQQESLEIQLTVGEDTDGVDICHTAETECGKKPLVEAALFGAEKLEL